MTIRKILVIGLGLWVGASALTSPWGKPESPAPLLSGATIEPRVLEIFRRACQDCHSELTSYPWYSYVAPVSLIVQDDVKRGRQHLNLSRWSEYPPARQERALTEIGNQVKDREMPLKQYVSIHKEARLTDEEIEAVLQWTQRERAQLAGGQPPK